MRFKTKGSLQKSRSRDPLESKSWVHLSSTLVGPSSNHFELKEGQKKGKKEKRKKRKKERNLSSWLFSFETREGGVIVTLF